MIAQRDPVRPIVDHIHATIAEGEEKGLPVPREMYDKLTPYEKSMVFSLKISHPDLTPEDIMEALAHLL